MKKFDSKKYHQEYRKRKLTEDPVAYRAKMAMFARNWRTKNRDHVRNYQRSRQETGDIANENNVIFYGYKEPLRKFEGGFGYQGVLMYMKDVGKVQCHLCGKLFRALNNGHLGKVHKITAAEYKEKTGLSQQTSLLSEETRVKILDRGWNPNNMEELEKARERRREITKKTGKDPQSHPKIRLEIKNQRGTCPDQLLDIIEKTIKSHGRVMTAEEFLKFHNGKYMGSIRATYGTWTNALEKLGKRPNNLPKYDRQSLLDALKNFYEVNKRTARWSDFARGLVPSPFAYYKQFKNLNHARLLAGVPLIIQLSSRKKEEWMPSKQEREKMLQNI